MANVWRYRNDRTGPTGVVSVFPTVQLEDGSTLQLGPGEEVDLTLEVEAHGLTLVGEPTDGLPPPPEEPLRPHSRRSKTSDSPSADPPPDTPADDAEAATTEEQSTTPSA